MTDVEANILFPVFAGTISREERSAGLTERLPACARPTRCKRG